MRIHRQFSRCSSLNIFIVMIFISCSVISYGSKETDMLSLLAIKAQITQQEALISWNESIHFCLWKGVACGKRHRRVTALNLSSQSLTGYLSPAIGNLTFLRILDLSNNSFRGEVPSEISYLFRLEELYLENNRLEGSVPRNISGWSNLRIMSISNNNFTGQVPFELGFLSRLIQLDASHNLFSGPIPVSLGNLSLLETLNCSQNTLTGSVPENIGRLKQLNVLNLAVNNLTGLIPANIYNLSYLTELMLADNSFVGAFPSDMFLTLPELRNLNMWGNELTGVLPVSISNASKLEMARLQRNKLYGTIPDTFRSPNLTMLSLRKNNFGNGNADDLNFITSLTNCSHLRILALGENNLGGALPASIGNLSTKLEILLMSTNKISGNIPASISNLISLNSIYFTDNLLTGSIPETIGTLRNLQEVSLGINSLSGNIPSSLGNLSLLKLWIRDTNVEGNIPASLGNCKSLSLLHLYGNSLNGTIPAEVMSLSSLSISLNLAGNHLVGPLPTEVGKLRNLAELDVSNNKLSGEIPRTIESCTSLQRLRLDYNSFNGTIPNALATLRGLEEINLSFNNFQGAVPTEGVFKNASQVSISGNQEVCGGIPDLQLPTCSSKKQGSEKLSPISKVVIFLVSGVFGLSLVLFLMWRLLYKKEGEQPSSVELVFHDNPRKVTYGDLFKATKGFSQSNFVGKGGFGSVYKGILEPEQTTVAVKVLDLQKSGASKSFIKECEALRNIRHKNLIKVITTCSSLNNQGDEFKAIVYEFMPNGSLERWLHPDPLGDIEIQELNILSLSQRLSIAVDVASALDYLHNECETPIIHCDLKPSNILLDEQMIAHVGDFGLAKIVQSSDTMNQISSSTGIKGTIGYTAPEYGTGSVATIEGDVYSFGILLLEIFTGKRPTADMFKDGLDLHGLAKMSLTKEVMDIIDHTLLLEIEEAQMSSPVNKTLLSVQEWLSSIMKIGVVCSEKSPSDRLNIHEALKELRTLKNLVSDKDVQLKRREY